MLPVYRDVVSICTLGKCELGLELARGWKGRRGRKPTSKTSTNVSSTNKASNSNAITTCASPSTKNAALTQAVGPWNINRKAACGRYVKVKRRPRTTIEVMVRGMRRRPKSG